MKDVVIDCEKIVEDEDMIQPNKNQIKMVIIMNNNY